MWYICSFLFCFIVLDFSYLFHISVLLQIVVSCFSAGNWIKLLGFANHYIVEI